MVDVCFFCVLFLGGERCGGVIPILRRQIVVKACVRFACALIGIDRLAELLIRKEGNVLFDDARNTFYLRLYGVGHMVKDHSDSERGNPLPPHGLLFPINSKGSFICNIPHTG